MQKKTRFGLAVLAAVSLFAGSADIFAAKIDDGSYQLPQEAGVYDVPGRADLKLKVFVYKAKDGDVSEVKGDKVQPVTPPELVCQQTTVADPDSDSVIAQAGWKLPASWTYRVNVSSVPATVGADRAGSLIGDSYASWQEVLGTATIFSRGADTNKVRQQLDGQNIVTWGRADSSALAVTYTWYYTDTGMAAEIDTIMNSKFAWYWSDPSTWPENETCAYQGVYDAQDILTHELGHTVGLSDEYTGEYVNSTMYGYGATGETKKNTLTLGDIFGAKTIYSLN